MGLSVPVIGAIGGNDMPAGHSDAGGLGGSTDLMGMLGKR